MVVLYNTMKQHRLTLSYCLLLAAVSLAAFSGLWHPLLHHVCPHPEKQELVQLDHVSHAFCEVCLGLLQTDPPPESRSPQGNEIPPEFMDFSAIYRIYTIPREHSPRAPPSSLFRSDYCPQW